MPPSNVADISIGIQVAKGVAAATPLVRTPIVTNTLRPERTINRLEETGQSRLGGGSYVAFVRVAGEVVIRVRADTIVPFLWAALGAKATTGAADPWTHTETIAATQPYCTIWTMLADGLFNRLIDCKITSLNFVSDAQGVLTATVGIVGITPQWQNVHNTTAALATLEPFVHHEAQGQLVLEGAVASGISAARVSIGTGADTFQGDALVPDAVDEGAIEATIETDQRVADYALWNRFHYGTATPANNAVPSRGVLVLGGAGLDFKWSKRDAVGAVATPARSLQFTATQVEVVGIGGMEPAGGANPAPLRRTVTYRIASPASGSGLTAIVQNAVTAYAAS